MIIIAFDNEVQFVGGYGDRIVGLVACKVMADLLERPFRILWTKENIKPYFDYAKYDLELDPRKCLPTNSRNLIDDTRDMKHYLANNSRIFPLGSVKLYLNTEISRCLYENPMFKGRSYLEDIFAVYKSLYTDIFVPTPTILDKIDTLFSFVPAIPVIGIQIRTGDIYIKDIAWNGYKVIDSPEDTLPPILEKIKAHVELTYSPESYKVFITSDYPEIYSLAQKVWNPAALLYIDEKVQHMDRYPLGDFSKIFVDNYILSQKTRRLYISEYSNYGRVAALSSVHEELFSIKCEPVNKEAMLTK